MTLPKRWLEEGGGASGLERELLRSAKGYEPPAGEKDRILANVLSIGAAASAGASVGTGAKAAGVGKTLFAGLTLKGTLLGLVGAACLTTALAIVIRRKPETRASIPSVAIDKAPVLPVASKEEGESAQPMLASSAEDERIAATTSEPDAKAVPAPTGGVKAPTPRVMPVEVPHEPSSKPNTDSVNSLAGESALLSEARGDLRSWKATEALSTLERLEKKYPSGMLVQEREALRIEALYASGRRSAADEAASAFLKDYPSSPLAKRVQGFRTLEKNNFK